MRRVLATGVLAAFAACGGSGSPAPSTPTNPGTPQQTRSIAGRVTDIVTGAGVASATVNIGGTQATTSADGSWQANVAAPSGDRVQTTITVAGYHTRETYVGWTNSARTDVAITIFPDRQPFSLGFYREMIRDGLESPSALEPLRRWTTNPNIYLQTLNPKTGQALTGAEVDALIQNVRDAVSQVTGGLLSVGTVETGLSPRPERSGTITIDIKYEPNEDYCGIAYVGANPGSVTFNYGRCANACGGRNLGPELIAHEIGHALGFWHVTSGVMQAEDFVDCPTVNFTQTERLHGSVAYRRPSGNLDIDKDPSSFSALTAPGAAPVIRCGRKTAKR